MSVLRNDCRSDVDERFSAAWDEAVDTCGAMVWRHVRNRSRSASEAAEIFQLVWLRLEIEARSDGLPADLPAWLLHEVNRQAAAVLPPNGEALFEPDQPRREIQREP